MRYVAFYCCAAVLAGCAKGEQKQPAQDTTATAAPTPPAAAPAAPAAISLADVAGKWTVKTMNEKGDSTLVTFELVATSDTTGWTFNFPKRKPLPVHVTVSGDSVMLDAGPYPSVLRKGVQVTTHGTAHLQDGKLMGTTVAHYATHRPDSVLTLKFEATKAK